MVPVCNILRQSFNLPARTEWWPPRLAAAVCRVRAPRPTGRASVRRDMAHRQSWMSREASPVLEPALGGRMSRGLELSRSEHASPRRASLGKRMRNSKLSRPSVPDTCPPVKDGACRASFTPIDTVPGAPARPNAAATSKSAGEAHACKACTTTRASSGAARPPLSRVSPSTVPASLPKALPLASAQTVAATSSLCKLIRRRPSSNATELKRARSSETHRTCISTYAAGSRLWGGLADRR